MAKVKVAVISDTRFEPFPFTDKPNYCNRVYPQRRNDFSYALRMSL